MPSIRFCIASLVRPALAEYAARQVVETPTREMLDARRERVAVRKP
jgi:hypothetical protein